MRSSRMLLRSRRTSPICESRIHTTDPPLLVSVFVCVQFVLELAHGTEGHTGGDEVIFQDGSLDLEVLSELCSHRGKRVQTQPGQGPQQAAFSHPHGQHAGVARTAKGGKRQIQTVSDVTQTVAPASVAGGGLGDLGILGHLCSDDVDRFHSRSSSGERARDVFEAPE